MMVEQDFEVNGEYRYRLSSTGGSSHQYGNCMVCGKHCTEAFIQTEQRHYTVDHNDIHIDSYTEHDCKTLFGHENCLKSTRRS
jgi:hypothetical protein